MSSLCVHISSDHKSFNRTLQSTDFVLNVERLGQVSWWIGSEVTNTQTAIKIAANVVAYKAAAVAADNGGAEKSGAATAVDVMAP